jgi:hypothetical protein
MSYTPKKQHAPIDDSVQVPAAIRAAAARSEALHKQAYEAPAQEAEAPNANANVEQQQNGENREPTQANNEVTPQPEVRQEGAPASAAPQADNWEHKYNSLKGRYDRQDETVRGLNNRISQLEGLLARAQDTPAAQPTQANPDLKFKSISAEDREAYGDDFLDVAARAAQERLNPTIASLQRELESLKGQVGGVAAQTQNTVKQNMYAYLDSQQANWRELNRDPKFIAWANLPDAFSGDIRISMMRDAFDKGDSQRVLRFFQGYLADEAATDPAGGIKPVTPNGKIPLETFAAPGRAKAPAASASQAQAPGEKETITHAQIAAFYQAVNKGAYRGNEAEKNRLEQMIFAAQAEGRVV